MTFRVECLHERNYACSWDDTPINAQSIGSPGNKDPPSPLSWPGTPAWPPISRSWPLSAAWSMFPGSASSGRLFPWPWSVSSGPVSISFLLSVSVLLSISVLVVSWFFVRSFFRPAASLFVSVSVFLPVSVFVPRSLLILWTSPLSRLISLQVFRLPIPLPIFIPLIPPSVSVFTMSILLSSSCLVCRFHLIFLVLFIATITIHRHGVQCYVIWRNSARFSNIKRFSWQYRGFTVTFSYRFGK